MTEYVVTDEVTVAGQVVKVGETVKVTGLRGSFKFTRHVTTTKGEWIECWGGPSGRPMTRSFAPDRIQLIKPIKRRRTKKGGA